MGNRGCQQGSPSKQAVKVVELLGSLEPPCCCGPNETFELMEPDLTLEVRHDTSMFPVPPTGSAAWASAHSVSAFQNVAGDTGTSRAS
ncbi:hypothetical protein DPX16_22114 [Anabarilius grahami]|uniref:Uncharacterized protein n=1 Tax=Anabarilius grahami TaxID=495550 RepID=A0A3N0XQZ0_ANAGA|nr:hypothetical protein DPX16_22114 [Anabarilius grahami]